MLVLQVSRHGARSGEFLLDLPEGKGQLTGVGMRQCYLLGKQNAYEYVTNSTEKKLLSEEYKEGEIYARSTKMNRTLESIQSQLLGIYPTTEGELTSKQRLYAIPPLNGDMEHLLGELGTMPLPMHLNIIPLHAFPSHIDQFFWGSCFEGVVKCREAFQNSTQVKQIIDANLQTLTLIMTTLNKSITDYGDIYKALSAIYAANFGFDPSGFSPDIVDKALIIHKQLFPYHFSLKTPSIYKLIGSGPIRESLRMLDTALNQQRNATNYTTPQKLLLVSTHDSTLAPMLAILGKNFTDPMPFASELRIVLDSNGGLKDEDLVATLLYNGKKMDICGDNCSYAAFKIVVDELCMEEDQRKKECVPPKPPSYTRLRKVEE